MGMDRLRVEANERVDIEDYRFLASEGIQAGHRQLGHKFFMEESVVTSEDRTGYILSGFGMSNPAAKQLQVDMGKALLSQRLDGVVVQGVLTTEGTASRIVDLNSYTPGDYGIYVRFEEVADDSQSRIFWNPTGDGSEYTNSIATRYAASWSLRVESASPGTEWLRIGEVAQATMVITDERPFYYEGVVDSGTPYLSGWSSDGGGNATDRNADRSTYGVGDLHAFVRATKQCLEDLKGRGLKRWWDRDIGGMNIGFDADPVTNRLAIGAADFYFEVGSSLVKSSLLPTADDTYDLGGVSNEWQNLWVDGIARIDTLSLSTAAGEGSGTIVPIGDHGYDLGNSSYRWRTMYLDTLNLSNASSEGVDSHLYPVTTDTYSLGDTGRRWSTATIYDVYMERLHVAMSVTTDLIPTTNSAVDLGSVAKHWRKLYVSALAGTGVGNDLVPDAAGKDLGNASYPWEKIFTNDFDWGNQAHYFASLGSAVGSIAGTPVNVTPIVNHVSNEMYDESPGSDDRIRTNIPGFYKFDFSMFIEGSGSGTSTAVFEIQKDGTNIYSSNDAARLLQALPAVADYLAVSGSIIVEMSASSYIQILVYRSSGTPTLTVGANSKVAATLIKQTVSP